MQTQRRKLLDQIRDTVRRRHYSPRTEEAYVSWAKRYILFHNKQHPANLDAQHITSFLTHLAVDLNVSSSTQNQALRAIVFLYRQVLHLEIDLPTKNLRSKKPRRLPVVLTKQEVQQLFQALTGTHLLMAKLLYGSGLRLMECVQLRIKDVDFGQHQIIVSGFIIDTLHHHQPSIA